MKKAKQPDIPVNKIKQAEVRTVMRSEMNPAAYNPRRITDEAKKLLKDNLKRVGLLGGIIWNEDSGNIVSGHQRITVMDEVNRYDPATGEHDYPITVSVVHFDEKTEKEQNLFANNKNAQGEFDDDLLRSMFDGIDYALAGFDEFDLQMLGLGQVEEVLAADADKQWLESQVTGTGYGATVEDEKNEEMAAASENYKSEAENTKIDRSVNFYEDTPENQLARHAEIQKIKDRIVNQNDVNKDNGALSYVVVSFKSPTELDNFLDMFGFPFGTKYINGQELINRIEFGPDYTDDGGDGDE